MKKESENMLLSFHFSQGLALLPIILYVLIGGTIMVVFECYSMKVLSLAALIALLVGFFFCANKGKYWQAIVKGLAQYGNARLLFVFILIGVFSKLLVTGGIGSGFIWLGVNWGLTGGGFVVFCFLVSALISIGAGAPIAAMLAVVPIFYPAGVLLGSDPAVLTGALLSGVFFGDALSPSSQVIHTTIQTQHDAGTNASAPLLETLKKRLPYVLICGVLSAILFFLFGTAKAGVGEQANLQELCDARGLWMLIPVVVLLVICFKTSDLFLAINWSILAGLVTGLLSGCLTFADFVTISPETQEIHGLLFDGLNGVTDIVISTVLLYGLISIAVEGGMVNKCCEFLLAQKALSTRRGAEIVISLGISVVNILLAGCVLPSILMFKDVSDTIGQRTKVSAVRRSILLTSMTTNITAIIPINSAFVMGAITIIAGIASSNSNIPSVTPFEVFMSTFYCLFLTVVCVIWVVFGVGKDKE